LEVAAQPRPRLAVGLRHAVVEDLAQQHGIEAAAEDRSAAHDRAVGGREPIEPGHGGGLDAVWQLVSAVERRGAQEIPEELRVAARALDRELDRARRKARAGGRGLRKAGEL